MVGTMVKLPPPKILSPSPVASPAAQRPGGPGRSTAGPLVARDQPAELDVEGLVWKSVVGRVFECSLQGTTATRATGPKLRSDPPMDRLHCHGHDVEHQGDHPP